MPGGRIFPICGPCRAPTAGKARLGGGGVGGGGRRGGGWRFPGKGSGQGVGMCQWGANGMAKGGVRYREILARYYPRTRLASLPGGPGPPSRGGGGKP